MVEYLRRSNMVDSAPSDPTIPIAAIWRAINGVRVIGPAPIIDVLKTATKLSPGLNFLTAPEKAQRATYIDALSLYVFPMLDGILRHEAEELSESIASSLGLDADGSGDLLRRLQSLAV